MLTRERLDTLIGGITAGLAIGAGVVIGAWLIAALVVGTVAIADWIAGGL